MNKTYIETWIEHEMPLKILLYKKRRICIFFFTFLSGYLYSLHASKYLLNTSSVCLPLLAIIWQTEEIKDQCLCAKNIILFEVTRLTDLMICAGEAGRTVGREWARQFCDRS